MSDFYKNEAEIIDIVKRFRSKQLPESEWTHEAHLAVGIYLIKNYGRYAATCYLRSGIIEYNASLGGQNTASSGYHETITLFWIALIDKYIKANLDKNLLELCNAFLKSKYASRKLLEDFYSKAVLFSTKGRAVWVEPDRGEMGDLL